jgi:hypothetical protein
MEQLVIESVLGVAQSLADTTGFYTFTFVSVYQP